ncbi:MAG: hypothetical protein ABUL46_02010 [Chitinophaga rupis]
MNKKWPAGVIILILLITISAVYIFIPRTLTVSVYTKVNCSSGGALRMINGSRFWEGLPQAFHSNDTYRLTGNYFQRVTMIRQRSDGKEIEGSLKVVSLPWDDTVVLQWSGSFPTSLNPVKRVIQYQEAKTTKREMTSFLSNLSSFLGRKENIYGVSFNTGMITDTEMVTTRWARPAYPGTTDIYEKIGLLRSYIKSQGAKETGYPMLNATREKNDSFEIMVAIPVNRRLAGNTLIASKRFVSWKTFEGEVKGGPAVAEEAMKQLHYYVTDYRHTFMSIPFQSLMTERNQEPDTLKWVTRVVQLVN